MITAAKLRNHTVKDLAAMAKVEGVSGWHSMRKEQLVKALLKLAKEEAAGKKNRKKKTSKNRTPSQDGAANKRDSTGRFATPHTSTADSRLKLRQIREKLAAAKNLAHQAENQRQETASECLTLTAKDPFWLHAHWELTPQCIRRAQVALGRYWHAAEPVLRLLEIGKKDTDLSTKHPVRDIVVHGEVNDWYIDVSDPPRLYQVEIGYRADNGRFLCLARSHVVSTAAKQTFEKHNSHNVESSLSARFGLGAQNTGRGHDGFPLEVDAELLVFGVAEPGARVTLKGEPISTKADGTFTIRFPLPDRRQVFPVVADSGDGMERRTVVLAVERNTKVMAPVLREPGE